MIRLLLAFLSAVALAISPVAVANAAATPAGMADCGMKGEMPAKPADHGKMDCCAPACQASSAAFLAESEGAAALTTERTVHAIMPIAAMISFAPTGLDPPPRLLS